MKFIEKILSRYNLVTFILIILILAMSLRLAVLTIAQGDYYRDLSDNQRLKEIHTTAPRGEIRDRYGRLLAGNIPSFTVQLLKDELNFKDAKKKNEGFLKLIRLLEEDGVSYVDEYPLDLNVFKYREEADYTSSETDPKSRIVEIIIENNLVEEFLSIYYTHDEYSDHYKFIALNRAINSFKNKGINIPITAEISDGELSISFNDPQEDIPEWLSDHGIPANSSPLGAVVSLIDNDKTIIRTILEHPLARKAIYDKLAAMGLTENIVMEEFSISYQEEYLNQKRTLMKTYPQITMNTSAQQDFAEIFTQISFANFLDRVIHRNPESKEDAIIPGKLLIDMLNQDGKTAEVTVELSEDGNNVIYSYMGNKDIGDQSPKDILMDLAKSADIIERFLSEKDIRGYAQEQLLSDGVNPRISIADGFEYVAINNLNNWYEKNKIKEVTEIKEAFDIIRKNYSIDENLSRYEIRAIITIYNQLSKQGYLAYQPINIAYGIKESTVARIEEGLIEMPGINISIEPVRFYPHGETAAHILGYLGKISQSSEIEKYVVEKKYSPSAIIGKTGVEESFEDMLAGVSGVKRVEVDVVGNTTRVISEQKPIPGHNTYLSIDLDTQKVAEEALKQTLEKIQVAGTYESQWGNYKFGINKSKKRPYISATSGAMVAIDVKDGSLIAQAIYPSYDPNLFSTGISDTDWLSLFPEDDKNPLAPRPLYNIATQTAIQPGSTFKMVTALAALENGLNPNLRIRDMGYVDIGTARFRCLIWTTSGRTHGYENVYEALRDSCNYYFYTLALGKNQRTGQDIGMKLEIEHIVDMSKQLGLNDKTGIEINIPAELSGGVPNPQRKIINTKALLKRYLNNDLEKYLKDGVTLTEEERTEIIEEIISWTELEVTLTRGEVVRRLDAFGLNPEKKIPGERDGIADRIKFTYLNQAGWNISDTLNVTIGQGDNSYTPMQMANYISTISNGGYRHNLTLIDNIKNYNNTKTLYEHVPNPERIVLNNYDNLEHVKRGMEMVSEDGTSRTIFGSFPIKVGSKTGTAQRAGINPYTGDTFDEFAWFVAYAPADDPKIAVAAVIFQGGSGGYAGPMVRDAIAQYLGLNNTESQGRLPYENTLTNE